MQISGIQLTVFGLNVDAEYSADNTTDGRWRAREVECQRVQPVW